MNDNRTGSAHQFNDQFSDTHRLFDINMARVCVCVCMYACLHVYVCVCVLCVCVHVRACMRVWCTCACLCVCDHVCGGLNLSPVTFNFLLTGFNFSASPHQIFKHQND